MPTIREEIQQAIAPNDGEIRLIRGPEDATEHVATLIANRLEGLKLKEVVVEVDDQKDEDGQWAARQVMSMVNKRIQALIDELRGKETE